MASDKGNGNMKANDKKSTDEMVRVQLENNMLKVPTMGTSISILSISKDGRKKLLPLVYSAKACKFLAIFDEPQVDLEVCIDNSASPQNMNLSLEVHKALNRIEVNKHSYSTLRNIHHRKIQIVPQSSVEALYSIDSFRKNQGITFQNAAQAMSQMTFRIAYARRDPKRLYSIQVHDIWKPKKFLVEVVKEDTVENLKLLIQDEVRIPPDQQKLIYQGKVLQDHETLESCSIDEKSKISLLTGGEQTLPENKMAENLPQASSSPPVSSSILELANRLTRFKDGGPEGWETLGERGIVVFQEATTCQPYHCPRYEVDRDTRIKHFSIEFRYLNNADSKH